VIVGGDRLIIPPLMCANCRNRINQGLWEDEPPQDRLHVE
jgi:hypothetical protein